MAVAVVITWPTINAMSQGSYQSIWKDIKKSVYCEIIEMAITEIA